jgi:GT2 family glycosyltransferase
MSKVLIVILHYGSSNDTLKALKSVVKQRCVKKYILIVDNHPENRFKRSREKTVKGKYEIIECVENNGYAAGNNIAINAALMNNYQYVFIMNNDAEIMSPFLIRDLVCKMEGDNKLGILAPNFEDQGCDSKFHLLIMKIGNVKIKQVADSNLTYRTTISGASFLLRTAAIRKVGLLNEAYFLYCEEDEYCLRMNLKGYRVAQMNRSKSVVKHVTKDRRGAVNNWVYILNARNLFIQISVLGTKIKLLMLPILVISEINRWFRPTEWKVFGYKLLGYIYGVVIYLRLWKMPSKEIQRVLCEQGRGIKEKH